MQDVIKPSQRNNPMYARESHLKLQCLGDYLRLGAVLWARHHGETIPTDMNIEEVLFELEDFKEWLIGDLEQIRLVGGYEYEQKSQE